MRPLGSRCVFRQILLMCVVFTPGMAHGDEDFPNELNSSVEEPKVRIPDVGNDAPFRSASQTKVKSTDSLVQLAQEAIGATQRRLLSTDQHTPWQIMHGLLALRHDFQVKHNGTAVSGLNWISTGPTFDNVRWFEATEHGGRAQPYSRPYAFEGHANQFLAILSMSGLELDHEFQTATGSITMEDMLKHAQKTIDIKDEVTWTLWALSRYLPPNAQWRNAKGELWSIERLVRIQTEKPIQGSPCGGTHGLFALAHARNIYLRQGKPLRGVWLEAEYKLRKYINTARMQQNSNGTFSTNFFRGREYNADFNKRMASAGHILEFLMIALPQEELQEQWVRRGIEATARDLLQNRKAYVRCSPLYHAVDGLTIYLDRVLQTTEVAEAQEETADTSTLKPLEPTKTALKRVPATSISQKKELDTADDGKETAGSQKTVPESNAANEGPLNAGDSGNDAPVESGDDSPAAGISPSEKPSAEESPSPQNDPPQQASPAKDEDDPAKAVRLLVVPSTVGLDTVPQKQEAAKVAADAEGARSPTTKVPPPPVDDGWKATPASRRQPIVVNTMPDEPAAD